MAVGTRNEVAPHDHVVQFYDAHADLIDAVGGYLASAVLADEVAVAVVTPDHATALEVALVAAGIDTEAARDRGSLIVLDAREMLARFMVHGWPQAARFNEVIGGLIEQAGQGDKRVRVFGEMVAVLWDEDNVAAAIELETMWNELGRVLSFSLFCAYAVQSVATADRRLDLHHVCQLHSAVVEAGEHARSFARTAASPTAARRFVVETLEMWGLHAVVDDATLVVTELATNAVLHAQTDFIVAVSARQGIVRLSVRDWSIVPPITRDAAPDAVSGRGLRLIEAIATRWGTELIGEGKLVWADLRH